MILHAVEHLLVKTRVFMLYILLIIKFGQFLRGLSLSILQFRGVQHVQTLFRGLMLMGI